MLQLSLLGEIRIRADGERITRFRSQTEIALLAYLAHSGKTHSREALADLLWEARSTKQSLSNLRTALARLRKRIGDQLIVTRKTVSLPAAVHEETDSVRLQAILEGAGTERTPAGINLLAQGLAMYGGEFMAGFSLANAPRFNDWLTVEQERLRQLAMNGYRRLTGWQEEVGAFAAGAATAQTWASWDPLDEMAQQQLMRLLAYDGRSEEALRAYERYDQLLQTELAVSPEPTTTALYRSIREGALRPPDVVLAPAHNLPRTLKPLFGRSEEIAAVASMLLDPGLPLVSITGGGGMGKTSLALAVGRHLVAEAKHPFEDGIWFIALETIENDTAANVKEEVAALVGQAMGLYFHDEDDLWTQLLGQLASKSLLLILDNIEQFLATAGDIIVDLLQAGDNVHLLVTSRATVTLSASMAYPLVGLATPQQLTPGAENSESVRLFAERAGRMPVAFDLQEHLADVVAICQWVEGVPLAIELTAASLGRLMIEEIMPALTRNLHLLDSSHSDLPPRQRTFQAIFDYSWALLSPRERRLLAQISVFRGGFTRQAAEAVLKEAASDLYNLQHHALLNRDESGRFRLHPLVRQLAHEKLEDPGMSEAKQQSIRRHSAYFADFVHSYKDDLRRGTGQGTLQAILPEQANVRAAWQYAVQAGDWQTIAVSLDSMHYFYQRKGFFADEAKMVDDTIAALREATEIGSDFLLGLQSRLLAVRALIYLRAADFEEGVRTAKQALALAQDIGDAGMEAQGRLAWAKILSTQHKREAALAQFETVVRLAQAAQDQFLEADGWIGIGRQLIWQEDFPAMQKPLYHALELCQSLQYKLGEMETLRYLGTMETRREAFEASEDYHNRALALSRLLGDVAAEAEELGSLGVTLNLQGDLTGSQIYQREALAIFRRLRMSESEQWILGELGYTAVRLGDYAGGEELLIEALAIATRLEDAFWQGWVKLRLGAMWYERGVPERGVALIKEAYQTAEQFQYLNFKAGVLYDWGNALLSWQDWATAEQKYKEAFDLRHGSGRTRQALPSLAGLAYTTFQQGRLETAAAYAEQLWRTWLDAPLIADRANLKLYWMLGTVWDGLGDSRARDLWKKANALLQDRCEKIPDAQGRKMFMEQVPAHRAILASAASL